MSHSIYEMFLMLHNKRVKLFDILKRPTDL